MLIDNAVQLQNEISRNAYFTLGRDGSIRTQSALARFFQKIGDIFRSAEAVRAREDRLQAAIARMLDGGSPVNPSKTVLERRTMPNEAPAPAAGAGLQTTARLRMSDHILPFASSYVSKSCGGLSHEDQNRLLAAVTAHLRGFPELEAAAGDLEGLRRIVEETVDNMKSEGAYRAAPDTSSKNPTVVSQPQPQSVAVSSAPSGSPVPQNAPVRLTDQIAPLTSAFVAQTCADLTSSQRSRLIADVTAQLKAYPGLESAAGNLEGLRTFVKNCVEMLRPPALPPYAPRAVPQQLNELRGITRASVDPHSVMRQGTNCCFMDSVVNGMLQSPSGRRMLGGMLQNDGSMVIRGQRLPMRPAQSGLSSFEMTISQCLKSDGAWRPGLMGDASEFAMGLGLHQDFFIGSNGAYLLSGFDETEAVQEMLRGDRLMLIHQGNHYRTVLGANDGRLLLMDSNRSPTVYEVPFSALTDARLTVLDYPPQYRANP